MRRKISRHIKQTLKIADEIIAYADYDLYWFRVHALEMKRGAEGLKTYWPMPTSGEDRVG